MGGGGVERTIKGGEGRGIINKSTRHAAIIRLRLVDTSRASPLLKLLSAGKRERKTSNATYRGRSVDERGRKSEPAEKQWGRKRGEIDGRRIQTAPEEDPPVCAREKSVRFIKSEENGGDAVSRCHADPGSSAFSTW